MIPRSSEPAHFPSTFNIGGHPIGGDAPCFFIAEAGVNHNGDLDRAMEMVDVAAQAGSDAVKFQTFSAQRLVTAGAPQAAYQTRNLGTDGPQLAMLEGLELDEGAHIALKNRAETHGMVFLSSPFDEESVELLTRVGVPAYKIGSGDLTNTPFLAYVARKGLPIIVSTGMADIDDVDRAMQALRGAGTPPTALLHCVSDYPAKPEHANLRAMATLEEAFGAPVGFSDHSLGTTVAIAAVALGAAILEKHFTLDRTLTGPDHRASLEPDDLAALVRDLRIVEAARGSGEKRPWPNELEVAKVARKSLVAARDVEPGEILTADAIVAKRPGTGIPPYSLGDVVGRRANRKVLRGTIITSDCYS